ncbi:MAG: recombinase family protein [Streptosporangiaceae bacterium]
MTMRLGYARVSTNDQHPEAQAERLKAAGCDKVFTDKGVSGKLARRPQWDRLLDQLRPGDALVTVRLDRIGRSVRNLLEVSALLHERGADLVVLDQGIDTSTPGGRFFYHVLAAMAEFEHDLIVERTRDGLVSARARGRVGGRKAKLSPDQVKHARELYDAKGDDGRRKYTVAQIGDLLGVNRVTVYRALERQEREQAASTDK